MVRITTWNVNGIRNPFGYKPWSANRTFGAMFDILEADIVIMQELKIQRKDLTDDMVLVPGWDCYFSLPKHKKGYSGVGIYTRQSVCAPIRAEEGLLGVLCPPNSSTPYRELPESASIGGYPTPSQVADLGVDPAVLDAEGRCLVLEFPAFVLFGVYSPANSNGLRDDFRLGFLTSLDTRIRNLSKMGKKIILTGDLNVSRDLIDTAKAEDNMRSEGITHEEYLNMPNRRIFNQLVSNSKVSGQRDEGREESILYDLCREFHPTREGMYTHWEQKINARPGNFGSRIDFILCSTSIKDWFKEANIQEGLMGSDHCPVYVVTKEKVPTSGDWDAETDQAEMDQETHILDLMNPPGMFKDGARQREYHPTKDVPALSGKLLPEFTKRRNIRDMFSKKPSLPKSLPETLSLSSENDLQPQKESAGTQAFPAIATDKEPATLEETNSSTMGSATNGNTAPTLSPLKSPEKRRAPASASPTKPIKRSKSSLSGPTTSATKGQQSLKGFFQSRTKPADASPTKDNAHPYSPLSTTPTTHATGNSPPSLSTQLSIPTEPFDSDPRASQEASREGWTKLFSKKPAPRCEHGEPCITLTTKKPGLNCGRQFWICPRPIGPSGQKEVGTQWRCGTFIWSSDWKGG
ncbi:Class II abasic (AP) endonuclease [Neocucurbitaria cava]|uniref:DNA-(apurinic or apyrimidinic site) endonuclease 2 n=1 Tax=Neocucurbitaria cava TaxID=798079 RepID=A0A9W9CPN9_9PLEO|nr:Class II abasic (AP) endonuclease [Neocucurbitaria cava]